jgi:hypothetical protein
METASAELIAKIDALTAQVEYLSAQARLAERQRQERAELVRDVTPSADQAFHLAIEPHKISFAQGVADIVNWSRWRWWADDVFQATELGQFLLFIRRIQ